MTDINHRRSNRKPVNQRHSNYNNGDLYRPSSIQDVDGTYLYYRPAPRHGYLDKVGAGAYSVSKFANKTFGAGVHESFSNGHRGMAKAVRGAKKYVRTRVRFHENAATKKLVENYDGESE